MSEMKDKLIYQQDMINVLHEQRNKALDEAVHMAIKIAELNRKLTEHNTDQ